MRMKRQIFLAALALALGACAGNQSASTSPYPADVAQAIDAAEHSLQQAAAQGYQWRDSGKLLEQARKAADAQDYARARQLAGKAERQGELALQQYHQQQAALDAKFQ